MKMIPGTGDISNYTSYTSNCTKNQKPYRIPIGGVSDVQLYIDIGSVKPTTVQYQLIDTCGSSGIQTIVPGEYVIAQKKDNEWYGVFRGFAAENAGCFVIAITLDDQIYFSEEYCIENSCANLMFLESCYGHLDADVSTDCEGIYFGVHAGTGDPLGDTTIAYKHKVFIRDGEVVLSSIKNSFKQGRTRTFRTEKEKIYQFTAEFIPEWYLSEIDSVFFRGEVYINEIRYLLNETQYEKIEDCKSQWKPAVTLKENCYQSFSCEADPCAAVEEECCDPTIISTSVEIVNAPEESGEESGEEPPPSVGVPGTIVIEGSVDGTITVTGTSDPVTGLTDGSTVITCDGFIGVRIILERGNLHVPGTDLGDGTTFYTKVLENNYIELSNALAPGEPIYIQTIPE